MRLLIGPFRESAWRLGAAIPVKCNEIKERLLTHRIRKGQFDLTELGLKEATASAVWNAVLSTR